MKQPTDPRERARFRERFGRDLVIRLQVGDPLLAVLLEADRIALRRADLARLRVPPEEEAPLEALRAALPD